MRAAWILICAALCVSAAFASAVRAADVPAAQSGADLYRQHCAACHGASAHGDGPVAAALSVMVPDLTLIAKRHGGTFPDEAVRQSIDGRTLRLAHGTRYMPVWGLLPDEPVTGAASFSTQGPIARLVAYLRSIQAR